MRNLSIAFFMLLSTTCIAQQQTLNVIPEPAQVELKDGNFPITNHTTIFFTQTGAGKSTAFLNSYLKKNYDFQLPVQKKEMYPEGRISLGYSTKKMGAPGGYTMKITNNEINISGNDEQGLFYGIQTLIQLLPTQ